MAQNIKEISDAEIMDKLLKELRYSALAFAHELEYKSHSTIDHILKGRNKISNDLIDKIIKKFPQVSYWFLAKGKLPVINENAKLVQSQANIFNSKALEINYNLESFATLKSIEKGIYEQNQLMREFLELIKQKKDIE